MVTDEQIASTLARLDERTDLIHEDIKRIYTMVEAHNNRLHKVEGRWRYYVFVAGLLGAGGTGILQSIRELLR